MVEVVSSLNRDGTPVARDLRWGVYVVFEAPNDYAAACFAPVRPEDRQAGGYAALYRPYHLIGLELGISVLSAPCSAASRPARPATAAATSSAVAKRDLKAGEPLDGEGGYTVWGKLDAGGRSLAARRALPIGLAHGVNLIRPVAHGQVITYDDVDSLPDNAASPLSQGTGEFRQFLSQGTESVNLSLTILPPDRHTKTACPARFGKHCAPFQCH